MSNITVYSKPSCVQCVQTKKQLTKENLTFVEIDITVDTEAYAFIVDTLGYRAAPVVVVRSESGRVVSHWSGFDPEKIKGLNHEQRII